MSPTIVGDVVKFIDSEGRKFNALVIHVWPSCVNIAFVDTNVGAGEDNFGRALKKETSVPWKSEGMSGFYVEP